MVASFAVESGERCPSAANGNLARKSLRAPWASPLVRLGDHLRNAGIEYFGSPRDNRDVYDAYVIDCVQDRRIWAACNSLLRQAISKKCESTRQRN